MKTLLLTVWQMPQYVFGAAFWLVLHAGGNFLAKVPTPYGTAWYHPRMRGGISLGPWIFMQPYYLGDTRTLHHETGHQRQSLYLGPLYLFVIGLPSLLHACWWNSRRNSDYYAFWTEKWADRLGGC